MKRYAPSALRDSAGLPPGPEPALAESLGEIRHLVILGMPRSGTTLVMNVLGEHPDVSMLDEDFESGIFRLTGSKIRGVKLCVPNQINLDRKWHPLYRLVHLNGMLRKSGLRRLRPLARFSIRDLSRLSRVAFVCVLRDPAANLDALVRRVRLKPAVRRAMWHRFIDTMAAMDAEPGWDVTFVSFEKLLADPESQIRQLCDRLDMPFHERMLEGPRYNRRYPSAGFDPERARGSGADGERKYPAAEALGLDPQRLETYAGLLAKAV